MCHRNAWLAKAHRKTGDMREAGEMTAQTAGWVVDHPVVQAAGETAVGQMVQGDGHCVTTCAAGQGRRDEVVEALVV